MISINIGNAYTGGFSLLNTWPSLGRIKSALFFGGADVLFSCFPRLSTEAAAIITTFRSRNYWIKVILIRNRLFMA